MYEVSFVENMSDFLSYTQIISLLQDQMIYIKSPKTNEEIMSTIKLVLNAENAKLMVLHDQGHIIGFAFFNICIGMESAGKYIWLNEMHIHRDYRSKGYGSILYNEMEKWCIENGIVRIMGMADETEVRTKKFYKTQGADIYKQDIISKYIK